MVVGSVLAYGHGDCLLNGAHIDSALRRHQREVALPRLEHVTDAQLWIMNNWVLVM